MKVNPAHIPQSLRSYLAHYQENPDNTIKKLEAHVRKRGADAVGYYLLSWFYHYNGDSDNAVKAAWKAKIYAPGSPAMELLHYFMKHPKKFKAWKPTKQVIKSHMVERSLRKVHPISDLDSLIEKLSTVETKRITFDLNSEDGPDLSEESSRVDDIVTDTLADIHEKQGNMEAAIETYQKLMQLHTHKKGFYKKQIERLETEIENSREKSE
jgi:tetratricopeptide (TPR) repeat protein